MTPDTRDDLLMSGMGIILVLACIGLGTIILSLAGCTIQGPALSLNTTMQAPCACPSPSGGVGPSGAIGPR